jgi:hypothetical protein
MIRILRLAVVAVLALSTLGFFPADGSARVWNVPEDVESIQAAVDAAVAGDIVELAAGTHTPRANNIGFGIMVCVLLRDGIVLRGATGRAADVIIDVQEGGTGIICPSLGSGTLIADLTVRNAHVTGMRPLGGGLVAYDSDLRVENCRFQDNRTDHHGGGALVRLGDVAFVDCEFLQNKAWVGGGVSIESFEGAPPTTVTFVNCVFRDNSAAASGGAMDIVGFDTVVALEHSTIVANASQGSGGGIQLQGLKSRVVMESCIVSQNSGATAGGGVHVSGTPSASLQASNTPIIDNEAVSGPDGWIALGLRVDLFCCLADPLRWSGEGLLVLRNDDCTVATADRSWSGVKALFR